jgi:hypothetical protein
MNAVVMMSVEIELATVGPCKIVDPWLVNVFGPYTVIEYVLILEA